MNSLRDECRALFGGHGMPYEKVSIMVAVVITVFFTLFFSNNFAPEAPVVVMDLDHSRMSREIISRIDASEYMHVTAVVETPADPESFFYEDRNYAVILLPEGMEEEMYKGGSASVGLFRDKTNSALNADIISAMNELVAMTNEESGAAGGGSLRLYTRNLFNPAGSTANGQTQGFLFFFGSMYFVFATIGMVPRLKLEHKWEDLLLRGNAADLALRIVPYGGCLLFSLLIGMAILRVWGDMVIAGNFLLFLALQIPYIAALGMMSILFGWTAANPGVASARMILFIPGGFILGGVTGPLSTLPDWVLWFSHFFPLTWEFHFVRDILMRGASAADIGNLIGMFFLYVAAIALALGVRFHREGKRLNVIQTKER